MELNATTRRISTERLASRAADAVRSLRDEPYTVVSIQSGPDAEPDGYLISPEIWRLLLQQYDTATRLTESPDFGELRRENNALRAQLGATLNELKARLGEDTISPECWRAVRGGLLDAIGDRRGPGPGG